MKKGRKKPVLIIAILFLIALFILICAFNSSSPQILSTSVYPEKVMPGQAMLIRAEIRDNFVIKNAKATIETDDLPDITRLLLVDGSIRHGKYERVWIAHDTSAQKWYNITITATNIFGKTASIIIPYQDPAQSHNASEITGGTFTGNYTFAGGDVNINRNTNLGGNVNLSGSLSTMDDYTKLLLHMNGADASTAFIDSATGKSVTANGNAQIDTAQSKFGGASGLFDGAGDYLTLADSDNWNFGTGDFTIDFWVRFNVLQDSEFVAQSIDGSNEWTLMYSHTGTKIYFQDWGAGVNMYCDWTPSVDIWYHIALVKSENAAGGTKIYIGGVSQTLTNAPADYTMSDLATVLTIGRRALTETRYLNGWIDELRISKGIARWTSNFNVPISEYGTAKFGDIQYYGEDKTTRFKVGSFTRDSSLASGTQSVTGVGFKPKAIIFLAGQNVATIEKSIGLDDGTTVCQFTDNGGASAGQWVIDCGYASITDVESAGNYYTGKISSFDSDGFTLSWTKAGSQTGTINIGYLAFR
jgi:hypothetical protein